jgi:heme exporter protein D
MEQIIPFFAFLLWLGLVIYLIALAARLVNAVEQIARSLAQRPLDRAEP